ncbi:SWIM zinc finger family protein [Streptomyces sp. NPDC013455]|uniref:SWIM zinc finger family protein n=1 Tax=Streptomyces sp. NPDC013455 TaxID=3155605 RepID=UPI0033DCF0A4
MRAEAAQPRVPTRPAPPSRGTGSESGQQGRSAEVRAVQDMRHYLATAFRMPTWPESPEEPRREPDSTGTPARTDEHRSATAEAHPGPAAESASTEPVTATRAPGGTPTAPGGTPSTSTDTPAAPGAMPSHPAPAATSPAPTAACSDPAPDFVHSAPTTHSASTSAPHLPPTSAAHSAPHPAPTPAPTSAPHPALTPDPTSASHSAPTSDHRTAPAPRVPATMATPHRDGELRRTFPAFGVREGRGSGAFAGTWWGNAWVGALEQGALDAKRLLRGRAYAERGHVDAITVTPGLVLAYVRGSRPRPYRVQVRVRTLEDADWERFLDAAADRPGHIAALLDKELPHSLADCGVPLLPGPGDLVPRCSCPDSGHPCKHAAALCYQTARLLDADPFVLLLLRGRGERELLDALSRRSAACAARAARERQPQTLPGVRATDALAPRDLPPLPPPLPVPPHPEQPPVYPSAPGGPDPFALDQLATDAAARAHALLGTGRDPVGGLTLWQDAVRLAAARPGSGLTAATRTLYATLADAVDRTPADLARAVAAWRQGGPAGLDVLEEPWDPPAGRFDRARPLLLAADLPAFRPWRNRLTHPRGHVQLRLGRDGLWYAYESEPGRDDWWPRGTPDLDPVGALTGLGMADGL